MTDELEQLADDYYDHLLQAEPTWAHLIGEYRYAGRFEAVASADEVALGQAARGMAARAESLDDEGLDDQGKITRSMVAWDATARADLLDSRLVEFGVDPIFGVQAGIGVYVPKFAIPDASVAEAMIDKFRAVGRYFVDLAERHREGVASGRTPAQFAVGQTVDQLDGWLAMPIDDDPMLQVQDPPAGVDAADWRQRLSEVLQAQVRPAVEAYRDVLRDEIGPHARSDDRCGLTWLADGDEAYARAARYYTTVDLTPAEIHEIGLRQVAALEDEYRAVGAEAVGSDDVPTIFDALRSDPALHHTHGDAIVASSKAAMAKARAAMADWFGRLPQADCDVEPTTSGAIAYYFAPPRDGSRGGVFFMNVSDPEGWGRFEIESTSYHEGIPGHHLQLAIAAELDDIPEFRKRGSMAAYAEGWGLYTERLADEMGLYSSPLDRIGMLSADSMRACRLVVDTGMHALGWSRQRAIDYLLANSPMRSAHVVAEIDRYAVTPGQALAYMIGRLEIQRMRREAEDRLGAGFDIKRFHDAVLDSGAMPLGILDRVVRARLR